MDGAYGGPLIFSEKHKKKLKGLSRADSFSFNAHKMLDVPTTCSVVVFKEPDILTKALNPSSKNHPISHPTSSKTSLYNEAKWDVNVRRHYEDEQRPETLKLWLLWKAKGMTGMGKHVNYCMKLNQFCIGIIKARPAKFELLSFEFGMTSCCFYYVPTVLRAIADRKSSEFRTRISKASWTLI